MAAQIPTEMGCTELSRPDLGTKSVSKKLPQSCPNGAEQLLREPQLYPNSAKSVRSWPSLANHWKNRPTSAKVGKMLAGCAELGQQMVNFELNWSHVSKVGPSPTRIRQQFSSIGQVEPKLANV